MVVQTVTDTATACCTRAVATSHAPNRLPASTEALQASLSLPHNLVVLFDGSCISQLRYKGIHARAERCTQMKYTFSKQVLCHFIFRIYFGCPTTRHGGA
jgi:hypothetical protein